MRRTTRPMKAAGCVAVDVTLHTAGCPSAKHPVTPRREQCSRLDTKPRAIEAHTRPSRAPHMTSRCLRLHTSPTGRSVVWCCQAQWRTLQHWLGRRCRHGKYHLCHARQWKPLHPHPHLPLHPHLQQRQWSYIWWARSIGEDSTRAAAKHALVQRPHLGRRNTMVQRVPHAHSFGRTADARLWLSTQLWNVATSRQPSERDLCVAVRCPLGRFGALSLAQLPRHTPMAPTTGIDDGAACAEVALALAACSPGEWPLFDADSPPSSLDATMVTAWMSTTSPDPVGVDGAISGERLAAAVGPATLVPVDTAPRPRSRGGGLASPGSRRGLTTQTADSGGGEGGGDGDAVATSAPVAGSARAAMPLPADPGSPSRSLNEALGAFSRDHCPIAVLGTLGQADDLPKHTPTVILHAPSRPQPQPQPQPHSDTQPHAATATAPHILTHSETQRHTPRTCSTRYLALPTTGLNTAHSAPQYTL